MTVVPLYDFYPDVEKTRHVIQLKGKVSTTEEGEDEVRHAQLHLCKTEEVERVFVSHPCFMNRDTSTSLSAIYPYMGPLPGSSFEVGCSILCQSAIYAPLMVWGDGHTEKGCGDTAGIVYVCNDWPCGMLPVWLEYCRRTNPFSKGGHSSSNGVRSNAEESPNLLFTSGDSENMVTDTIKARSRESAMTSSLLLDDVVYSPGAQARSLLHETAECSPLGFKGEKADTNLDRVPDRQKEILRRSKAVFLVHNMAFSGPSMKTSMIELCLLDYFTLMQGDNCGIVPSGGMDREEGNGTASWLDVGMKQSDSVVTVSPGYASEIAGKNITNTRRKKLDILGIKNGIDTEVWNPSKDPFMSSTLWYVPDTLTTGKQRAKEHLQRLLGLEIDSSRPVFGFVGRLDSQKGIDILLAAILHYYSRTNDLLRGQFVLLGCGDAMTEMDLRYIHYWFPGMAVGVPAFNEALAHQIMAGSDFLVIPSRFEPCGLVALYALRYGTLPIAPAIGGLKQFVRGLPPLGIEIQRSHSAGHSLYDDACRLYEAIHESMELHKTEALTKRQRRCMATDVSWNGPSREWSTHLASLMEN